MLQMLQGGFQGSAGLAHPAACPGNRVLQHLQHLAPAMHPMHPVMARDVANVACVRVITLMQFWPPFMCPAPVFPVPRARKQHLQHCHSGFGLLVRRATLFCRRYCSLVPRARGPGRAFSTGCQAHRRRSVSGVKSGPHTPGSEQCHRDRCRIFRQQYVRGRLWADRPDLLPTALRDSLAAHRPAVVVLLAEPPEQAARAHGGGDLSRTLPGVPLDWCEGVALLAARTAPPMILPGRWAVLATTSARLLRDRGGARFLGQKRGSFRQAALHRERSLDAPQRQWATA